VLITNFAAGELSETLFGRTDLPQYYSGAARLENFDVIPTGGITRRAGSRRDLALPGNGRLIPFIISRELSFLLYLRPRVNLLGGSLSQIVIEGGAAGAAIPVYSGSGSGAAATVLEYLEAELPEVHACHRVNYLILTHENYPPLAVYYAQDDNRLYSSGLMDTYEVPARKGAFVTDADVTTYKHLHGIGDDPFYHIPDGKDLRLSKPGNYPKAATFFNDRLLLAGSKSHPQRVFASRVLNGGPPFNFATYGIYLSEQRTYDSMRVRFKRDANHQIIGDRLVIDDIRDAERVLKSYRVNEWYIDSPLFAPGTTIESYTEEQSPSVADPETVEKHYVIATSTSSNVSDYTGTLLAQAQAVRDLFDQYNSPLTIADYAEMDVSSPDIKAGYQDTGQNYIAGYWTIGTYRYSLYFGSSRFMIVRLSIPRTPPFPYTPYVANGPYNGTAYGQPTSLPSAIENLVIHEIPAHAAEELERDSTYLVTFVRQYLTDGGMGDNTWQILPSGIYNELQPGAALYNKILAEWNPRVLASMRFNPGLPDFSTIYGYGPDILNEALLYAQSGDMFGLPVYRRTITGEEMTVADDGFTFEIASDINDAIRWMAQNQHLIIGTEMAEWVIPAETTAVNIQARLNSRYGSDRIQAMTINGACCFLQSGKKALTEYYIPQQDNFFRANNMAMLDMELLDEARTVALDFVSSPYTRLYVTRDDGVAAALLYERGTGTFAWSRLALGGGGIISLATIPHIDGDDNVYVLARRGTGYYLEVLRATGAVYLDSYTQVTAATWASVIAGYDTGAARIVRVVRGNPAAGTPDAYEPLPASVPPPDADGEYYIGYPYRSLIRTMPVLANNQMKKQRITTLLFRFLRSFMPVVSSWAGGALIKTDVITGPRPPYSGVWRAPFPGAWDEDVQVELSTDAPEPVTVLALNAEAQ
jgi:hypothetical protein